MTEKEDRELVERLNEGLGGVVLRCCGCKKHFICGPENERAEPDRDPNLIYCDACNKEAEQWCKEIEQAW